MKYLLFILLLIFSVNSFSQKKTSISHFKNLTSKDTLWIDYKHGSCFGGTWTKIVISKNKEQYKLTIIDDISKVLKLSNEKFETLDNIDAWIKENIIKISEKFKTMIFAEKEYITLLNSISHFFERGKNCDSKIAGTNTQISLEMDDLNFNGYLNCRIFIKNLD